MNDSIRLVRVKQGPARRAVSEIAIFAAGEDVLPLLGRALQGAPHQTAAARHQDFHACGLSLRGYFFACCMV